VPYARPDSAATRHSFGMSTIIEPGTLEYRQALQNMHACAEVAAQALCVRVRCGAVVARGGLVLGVGRNDPPDQRAPSYCGKDDLPAGFRSDRTCCVHAEQNAILNALRAHPGQVAGARMYFLRIDGDGNPVRAGAPYCTICSKLTQAAGIAEFVLWHQHGMTVYNADEYNLLSFQHADYPPDPSMCGCSRPAPGTIPVSGS
jgi:deoxycytidylate deaminase